MQASADPQLPSRKALGEVAALLSAVVAVLLVAFLARAGFDQFFMIDDAQNEYLPKYFDIGRSLQEGVWPMLTPRIWLGGNYVVEYQYGLFNPVQLALCWLMSLGDSLRTASFLFATTYLAIAAGGLYVLGRVIGLGRGLSALLGFFAGAELMVVYVYAASWYPGLCGFAWFGWALAAWWRTLQRPTAWSAVTVVASAYLVLTSGWPQSVVALLLAAAGLTGAALPGLPQGQRVRRVLLLAALMLAGLLLSAPAWLEMLAVRPLTLRSSGLHNDGNFMTFGLRQALLAHLAAFRDYTHWFAGYRLVSLPLGYACLLLAAIVCFCRWPRPGHPARPAAVAFGVLSGMLLLVAMGPSQLGPMRWPVRFVPYFHVALLCCALLVARHGELRTDRVRLAGFAAFVGLGSALAVLQTEGWPGGVQMRALAQAVLLMLVAAWAFVRWRHRRAPVPMLAVVLACGVLTHARVLSDLHTLAPGYLSYAGLPSRLTAIADEPLLHRGFALLMAPEAPALHHRRTALTQLNSAQPLLWRLPSINGYSPIGHAALGRLLPASSAHGLFKPEEVLHNLVAQSQAWQVNLARVMGIGAVVVPVTAAPDARLDRMLDALGFSLAAREANRQIWIQPQVSRPCGEPTAFGPQVQVEALEQAGDCPVSWSLRVRSGPSGGSIVLPRLWWPGYHATLDGHTELAVQDWHGLLVEVRLPPGVQGELQVAYRPSTLRTGLMLALAGLALASVGVAAARCADRVRARTAASRGSRPC